MKVWENQLYCIQSKLLHIVENIRLYHDSESTKWSKGNAQRENQSIIAWRKIKQRFSIQIEFKENVQNTSFICLGTSGMLHRKRRNRIKTKGMPSFFFHGSVVVYRSLRIFSKRSVR